jgi:hypothetical protein
LHCIAFEQTNRERRRHCELPLVARGGGCGA